MENIFTSNEAADCVKLFMFTDQPPTDSEDLCSYDEIKQCFLAFVGISMDSGVDIATGALEFESFFT